MSSSRLITRVVLCAVVLQAVAASALAQPGTVLSQRMISTTDGGFKGILNDGDFFGDGVVALGDLDGDGVTELAVGADGDDDGGSNHGAVWVLFLNDDGTVKTHQKISDTAGGFTGVLDLSDTFGTAVAALGDLDGDGVGDLAAGAQGDDDGGTDRGAVWVLFLNGDGTVKSHQKISATDGNFTGILADGDAFGISVSSAGDLDGDGVADLAVGAYQDNDGGNRHGAVWMLFLDTDGTVKSHQKISNTAGGFTGTLNDFDRFGGSVASLGDLDGDGVTDLAAGAAGDDDGGPGHGAVWVLLLNTDGTVKAHQKISDTEGGFSGMLDTDDLFGASIASPGDLDGDGFLDLAVGAYDDDDGGSDRGAAWVLFLNSDGMVKSHQKISDTAGGFAGGLNDADQFGSAVGWLGDLDGDGRSDLVVGANATDDGGSNRGAVWILLLNGAVACPWDCDDDGDVGIIDFRLLLAQWGEVAVCDFDGDGVGITDFLALLANWGPCP